MEQRMSLKELNYMLGSTTHAIKDIDSIGHHTEHVDNTDGVEGNHLVVRYSMNHKAVLLYICHS